MSCLTESARRFINRFQGGFPIERRPFHLVAESLGIGETALIFMVRQLVAEGRLSRFGPVYNASRFGGAQTLAAIQVPQARFEKVAQAVNRHDAVAHNYRREHALNMWFVVATEKPEQIDRVLDRISRDTGLPVYNFPKLSEFYLGLRLYIDTDGSVDAVPAVAPGDKSGYQMNDIDREIMRASQAGLPLEPEPYASLAGSVGCSEDRVMQGLCSMLSHGVIRRIGAVPNHYRLGLRANGMTVWRIPAQQIQRAGNCLAALPYVSHCYERATHPGIWPYNLFAMVHAAGREQVIQRTACMREMLGDCCGGSDILFSSRILKKTGLRLAA